MESTTGKYLLTRIPKVRRLKDTADSVLAGLMDCFGLTLDAAKDVIYSLRRRGFIWIQDGAHAYYAGSLRSSDLNLHALDRGTRRLAGETDDQLRQRLQAMPHVRQYMGSAMGMKYLVEEALGYTLSGLVVYRDDPQGWVTLGEQDQGLYVDENVSHVLSSADQLDPAYDDIRQNRIYSAQDLDYRYQFWMSITVPAGLSQDERGRITELIAQEKPAHTTARVHFVEV